MLRPNLPPKGGAKSSNPISNWLQSRKERQMEAQEEAAKLITNAAASNQSIIISKLNSIDFFNSRLPQKVLEHKAKPEHHYCELEHTARVLAQVMSKDTQVIKMDIRKLDEKIMTLVLLFKQAVEQGDERAAYAAKAGLMRGITEIRSRIPQNQPELAKQFVEKNAAYLDQWITLVTTAQVADRTKQNLDRLNESYEKALADDKAANEAFGQKIKNDAEMALAFKKLNDRNYPQDRTKWSHVERDLYSQMVGRRLKQVNLELNAILLQNAQLDLKTKIGMVDYLSAAVRKLPITTDPNLMNKYQESVDKMFRQMAESDDQIDELLKSADEIEGRIKQVGGGPGAQRAMEVAAEEAERALELLKKQEKVDSGISQQEGRKILHELGLHTEEEIAQMKAQQEAQEQEALEELSALIQEEEEETDLIGN